MNDHDGYTKEQFLEWVAVGGTSGDEYFAVTQEVAFPEVDPVPIYRALVGDRIGHLFETVNAKAGHGWGIGMEPYAVIDFDGECFHVEHRNSRKKYQVLSQMVIPRLRWLVSQYSPVNGEHAAGRAFGNISFEFAYLLDKFQIAESPFSPSSFPMAYLQFCRINLAYSAQRQTLKVSVVVPHSDVAGKGRDSAIVILEEALQQIQHVVQLAVNASQTASVDEIPCDAAVIPGLPSLTCSRDAYLQNVMRAQEHIAAGDIFQVVLSMKARRHTVARPIDIFWAMKRLNPSPYMYYLNSGKTQILGTSPEMLVSQLGRKIRVNPIAGTIARGTSEAQDNEFVSVLLGSEKDRAEHVMLVDLGRNDVGKVANIRSVTVDDYMRVEKYSHVIHLVSSVSGELKGGKDCFDAFAATFPAGTVSGAPKIRAMEIIHELEGSPRGPYAGAICAFDFNGDMDSCIAIRSIFMDGSHATLQAGAGIVMDSSPTAEYDECINKLKVAARAIEMAEAAIADTYCAEVA